MTIRLRTVLYAIQRILAPRAYVRGVQRENEEAEAFFASLAPAKSRER